MTDEELGLLEHITYIDKNVLEVAFPERKNYDVFDLKERRILKNSLKEFNKDALNNLRAYGDKTIDGAMMRGNVSQSKGITFPFLLFVFYKKSKPIKFV